MKTGAPSSETAYVITRFNRPIITLPTLASAWVYCFDHGFVVARGKHKPGSTAAQRKHRLDYGYHITQVELPKAPPSKRGKNSKKRKFKPENWIDDL